jgi:ribosomal protein S18 acetylase RimI-like enzyme
MMHEVRDREALRPFYERAPEPNVRARNVLYRLRRPEARLWVDDPDRPRAALMTQDGHLWDFTCPDPRDAAGLLDSFVPEGLTVFVGVAEPLLDVVRERWLLEVETPTDLYLLPEGAELRAPSAPPPTIAAIGPEEAAVVSRAWPHDDFESPAAKLAYVRACLAAGPAFGVREQGRPVSFALTHLDGSIGILHTEPTERRRGLGRHVIVHLARQVQAQGGLVFGYVAVGNTASQRLVESLGMRAVQRGAWLTVRPNGR